MSYLTLRLFDTFPSNMDKLSKIKQKIGHVQLDNKKLQHIAIGMNAEGDVWSCREL